MLSLSLWISHDVDADDVLNGSLTDLLSDFLLEFFLFLFLLELLDELVFLSGDLKGVDDQVMDLNLVLVLLQYSLSFVLFFHLSNCL